MGSEPLAAQPLDDSGTSAFERYCYQALVAVPLCLSCASGHTIRAVYAEYFEDLAVEHSDGSWRFLQVKTRDRHLGPWRLSNLTAADGGAFHSLLRTMRSIGCGLDYTLEALLEGPADPRDSMLADLLSGRPLQPEAVRTLCDSLNIDEQELGAFLERLLINADLPSRDAIEDRNRSVIGKAYPNAQYEAIERVQDNVAVSVYKAMQSHRLAGDYPQILLDPHVSGAELRIAAKRLDASKMAPLVGGLESPVVPVLSRITLDGRNRPPTDLELKLLAGGATSAVIQDAKQLRAQAAIREAELLGANPHREAELEDLRLRLQVQINAHVAKFADNRRPAAQAWGSLLSELTRDAAVHDPRRVMKRDPILLAGEAAQVSDLCLADWGRSN